MNALACNSRCIIHSPVCSFFYIRVRTGFSFREPNVTHSVLSHFIGPWNITGSTLVMR